jgi:hypothetical protein
MNTFIAILRYIGWRLVVIVLVGVLSAALIRAFVEQARRVVE